MHALFFGSIGSVVETSEMQRDAFNRTFREAGLDWHWDRATYRAMLAPTGGADRIASYAASRGQSVDAAALHARKREIFTGLMCADGLTARPGVLESLAFARQSGWKTALVSTTARASLDTVLDVTEGLSASAFDLVTSDADGYAQKPSPAAYIAALTRLGSAPERTIAVEDNQAGIEAAHAAALNVVAYLGANTATHPISLAGWSSQATVLPVIMGLSAAALEPAQ
ncbi:MAG: HAD-IA family hydrolase [Pseudomonadota bacterium]